MPRTMDKGQTVRVLRGPYAGHGDTVTAKIVRRVLGVEDAWFVRIEPAVTLFMVFENEMEMCES